MEALLVSETSIFSDTSYCTCFQMRGLYVLLFTASNFHAVPSQHHKPAHLNAQTLFNCLS